MTLPLHNPFRVVAEAASDRNTSTAGIQQNQVSTKSTNQLHHFACNQRPWQSKEGSTSQAIAARGGNLWGSARGQHADSHGHGQPHHRGSHDGKFNRQPSEQFSGRQNGFRGGQRGRSRGNLSKNRGGHRGNFHNTRGNAATNPSPGLFRAPAASFYCESCDIEFKDHEKLDDHVKEHVKCPKCDFVGVIESIEEHFEMIHLTVLKNRVKPVETEEDLKIWREERRSRYPKTKQCVQLKPKELPGSGKILSEADSSMSSCPKQIADADLSDGEIAEETASAQPTMMSHGNALMNLGCYGEEDTDSDGPEEIPAVRECAPCFKKPNLEAKDVREPGRYSTGSHDCLDSLIISTACAAKPVTGSTSTSHEITPGNHPTPMAGPVPHGAKLRPQPYYLPPKRKPRTLYEKLVAQDVQKDNDHLLQCIAHICSTNFLGMGPSTNGGST